jgi:hypothetical protein
MNLKNATAARIMGVTGTVVFGMAMVQFAIMQVGLSNGHPFDPAVAEANIVMVLVGIVASLAAYSLKKVEARLSRMEAARPSDVPDDGDTIGPEQPEGCPADLRIESATTTRL